MKYLIWFILIAIAIFFIHKFLKKFKFPVVGSLCIVTGGVKTGKTTFSVGLAISEYKRVLRKTKFKNFSLKLFRKPLIDLPLLYSNIPLKVPYVPVTKELLLRKERFVYGSVIYISEASLVADSQMIKDLELNERLLLFNKLIGHETKGGLVIYDTQTIADCHYSLKRCLSEYFYIHSLTKWIPFFLVANVIENRYSEDGSVIAVDTEDVELHTRKVIMRKSVWNKFDCYCYSCLTDHLPVANNVIEFQDDLKCKNIVSFKTSRTGLAKPATLVRRVNISEVKNEKKDG